MKDHETIGLWLANLILIICLIAGEMMSALSILAEYRGEDVVDYGVDYYKEYMFVCTPGHDYLAIRLPICNNHFRGKIDSCILPFYTC